MRRLISRPPIFQNGLFLPKPSFSGKRFLRLEKKMASIFKIFSEAEIDFNLVTLDPPDGLIFRDVDLRKVSLICTDLRKAEITGAEWPEIAFKWWRFTFRKRIGVYDEIRSQEGETHYIEKLYRELKQNYEDRRDYDRASDFHYGEKEIRRKNPDTPLGRRVLLWIYWLASGYGEICLRPILWAVCILIVSAIGYLYFGLVPKVSGSSMVMTNGWDFLKSLHYSLEVMTLLKPDDMVPNGFGGGVIHTVQMLLGPVLTGFFCQAFWQRLKR